VELNVSQENPMKPSRLPLFMLMLAAVMLLTACGAPASVSWPGLAVDQDTIYLADTNAVYAIQAVNGSLIWRYPETADTARLFFAAPAVANGSIVTGDYSHQIVGLDSAGKETWSYKDATGRYIGSAAISEDLVVAPNEDGQVYALTTAGALKWTFKSTQAFWTKPVLSGEFVYVTGMDHYLYALKADNGNIAWKVDLGGPITSSPLLSEDGKLYVGTLASELAAIDANNGSVLWKAKLNGGIWGKPVLKDGVLMVGDAGGKIQGIDANTGTIKWTVDAESPITGGGAQLGDGVVYGTEAGTILFIKWDGSKGWSQTQKGKIYTDAVSFTDGVALAIDDGDKLLIAYGLNGQELWSFTAPK